MRRLNLLLTTISAGTALLGCQSDSAAAVESYQVRAEVVELSGEGEHSRVSLRHEAIPSFKDRKGEVVGMDAMTMAFGLAPGVDRRALRPGAKLQVSFNVDWNREPTLLIERVEALPPEDEPTAEGDAPAPAEAPTQEMADERAARDPTGAAKEPQAAPPADSERAKAAAAKAGDRRADEPSDEATATNEENVEKEKDTTAVATPCGDKGQPACPLQGWMERNVDAPMERGDLEVVAASLRKAAAFAPEPGWNQGDKSWRGFALSGANAAAAGDVDAVKQNCKGCHRAFRKKYKAEHRTRPVP